MIGQLSQKCLKVLKIIQVEVKSKLNMIAMLEKEILKEEYLLEGMRETYLGMMVERKSGIIDYQVAETLFCSIQVLENQIQKFIKTKLNISDTLYSKITKLCYEFDYTCEKQRLASKQKSNIKINEDYETDIMKRLLTTNIQYLKDYAQQVAKNDLNILKQPNKQHESICICKGKVLDIDMIMCVSKICKKRFYHVKCLKESDKNRMNERWICNQCQTKGMVNKNSNKK